MFETETVGPCLLRKLKWEGYAPLPPASPVAPPLLQDTKAYLGSSQISMMKGFCENTNDFQQLIIFIKKVHFRCLTGSLIRLCQ